MRSEHGNSLHFISSAAHFLYKNFPKKYIFSTTTSPKSRFSLHKHPQKKTIFGFFFSKKFQIFCPQTQGRQPPPEGWARRADPPTLADPAIPKTGWRAWKPVGELVEGSQGQKILNTKGTHCRFGIAGNLGVVLAWLTECEHAATHKWGGHHMDEV